MHTSKLSYLSDVIISAKPWRIIYLRSSQAIRSRYARSTLGEFWSVLSVAFLIISTGLIWSFIWNIDAQQYLPYVACGHILYLFISGTINESTTAIIGEKRLFYKFNMSPLIAIHILVLRNCITFIHNIPIVVLVIAWSSYVSCSLNVELILYFPLVILFIFFTCVFLAILCVYYRDMIQLVGSILQISFLLTPVIWHVNRIPEPYIKYVYLNPFASAIEVIRNPILGNPISDWAVISLLSWIMIAFVLSYACWKFKIRNIIYWI